MSIHSYNEDCVRMYYCKLKIGIVYSIEQSVVKYLNVNSSCGCMSNTLVAEPKVSAVPFPKPTIEHGSEPVPSAYHPHNLPPQGPYLLSSKWSFFSVFHQKSVCITCLPHHSHMLVQHSILNVTILGILGDLYKL